jgi:hypothetical protein
MKRLPKAQHEILRSWVLGGYDSVAVGRCSSRSVDTLIRNGYLILKAYPDVFLSPTDKAREYVDACGREDHRKIGTGS